MTLSPETTGVFQDFLDGCLPFDDFFAWVVAAEGDDELPAPERRALTGLYLLLIEYGEGLRPLAEVTEAVREFMPATGVVLIGPRTIVPVPPTSRSRT